MASLEKSVVLTIRLDADLRSAFVAACKASDVTASQVLRAAMRQYLKDNAQAALSFKVARK